MNETNHMEAVTATSATVAVGAAAWLAQADHLIHTLSGIAMLVWWLRLWLKNPNAKPPETPTK